MTLATVDQKSRSDCQFSKTGRTSNPWHNLLRRNNRDWDSECLEYLVYNTHTHTYRVNFFMVLLPLIVGASFFQQLDTLRSGDIHTGGNHVQMARRDTWPKHTNKGKGQSQQMSWKSGAQSSKAQNPSQRICKGFATHGLGHAIPKRVGVCDSCPKVL